MRPNGCTLKLKPVWASALKYASIEIHIDHVLSEKSSKILYMWDFAIF